MRCFAVIVDAAGPSFLQAPHMNAPMPTPLFAATPTIAATPTSPIGDLFAGLVQCLPSLRSLHGDVYYTNAVAGQSQILTSRPLFFKMVQNLELRCVLVPAP